ncbi:hypothetical protein [Streptomyces mirabilis]
MAARHEGHRRAGRRTAVRGSSAPVARAYPAPFLPDPSVTS